MQDNSDQCPQIYNHGLVSIIGKHIIATTGRYYIWMKAVIYSKEKEKDKARKQTAVAIDVLYNKPLD
jgi:hypothetical protein